MRRFVLLSLAVHTLVAGVFWYVLPDKITKPAVGTLSVSLHTISKPVSENAPSPVKDTVADAHTTKRQQTLTQNEISPSPGEKRLQATGQPVVSKQADREPDNVNQAEAAQIPDPGTDMLDSVRRAVYRELQANFSYPRRARLRGWEGTVVITLRILPDGQLTDIRVADSSGISTLDRAAVKSLSKVSVPQAVAWMHGKELDMKIPVEYRLTDG